MSCTLKSFGTSYIHRLGAPQKNGDICDISNKSGLKGGKVRKHLLVYPILPCKTDQLKLSCVSWVHSGIDKHLLCPNQRPASTAVKGAKGEPPIGFGQTGAGTVRAQVDVIALLLCERHLKWVDTLTWNSWCLVFRYPCSGVVVVQQKKPTYCIKYYFQVLRTNQNNHVKKHICSLWFNGVNDVFFIGGTVSMASCIASVSQHVGLTLENRFHPQSAPAKRTPSIWLGVQYSMFGHGLDASQQNL